MTRRLLLLLLLLALLPAMPTWPVIAEADATGSISGRVTDILTGAPLEGATVEDYSSSIEATTDADGRYRLVNVPEGKRYLRFDHPRYASEYYVDAPRLFLATPVEVKAGKETTGIDAALGPGGRISGRVTDLETGAGLAGVRVRALQPDLRPWWPWRSVREAVTGADGRYAIEGLWTDVYHVDFVDEAGDHATQGYGASVAVLTGEEVEGIDIALQHEGHIAGQVTDLVTGEPLAGVTVSLLGVDSGGDLVAAVETDSNGLYAATSLVAGEYWLHFEPHDKTHAARHYGGEAEFDSKSQRVRVEVGRTTAGVDQQLPELAAITGRVTDATTGAGLRGIGVYLDWYSEYRAPHVTTHPDGTYIIPSVTPGKHTVWVHDPNGAYRDGPATQLDDTETVAVEEGRVSRAVNAALTPLSASLRKITGTVTDVVTGQPLAGIRATVYDCWQSYHLECWDTGAVSTDAAGQYTFYDPGSAWGITFTDPNNAYLAEDAPNFRLPGPDEVVVLDAALQRYDRVHGGIAGKVTALTTGEPLAGQAVCAHDAAWSSYGCSHTAADGTYRIDGLTIGQHQVVFGSGNWIGARHGQQSYSSPVTVRPNEITPNIDGALPEQGRIAGTVRTTAGGPLAGATVQVCSYNCDRQTTAADGTYLSTYLSPGAWDVMVSKSTYQWTRHAEPVTVTYASVTAGIDITLPALGVIAGRVIDADTGAAVEGVTVQTRGWGYSATTNTDGRYTLANLEPHAYGLKFKDDRQRYGELDSTETVTVTLDQTVTFDVQLIPNGYITGRVTAAESGAPLGGIEVRANYPWSTTTAPDGTYKIGPLPDGDYQVRFWDGWLLRRMEYYWEATGYNSYTPVTVRHGETTTGIDESMDLLAWARGRVIDADTGAPLSGIKVWGSGEWPKYNPVNTDSEGRYELKGLNDGTYSLTAQDSSHLYIDGASDKLAFQAGQIVDVPDIKLKRWGEFGGTVTDERTGQPVAGIWVVLYHDEGEGEWSTQGYAITATDGTYRIRGMYDNPDVCPVFYDPRARYHAQSYGGGKSLLDSQTASFKRGSDTRGVDAMLVRRGDGPPQEPPHPVWLPLVVQP